MVCTYWGMVHKRLIEYKFRGWLVVQGTSFFANSKKLKKKSPLINLKIAGGGF